MDKTDKMAITAPAVLIESSVRFLIFTRAFISISHKPIPLLGALHKKSGKARQLDLKSAIANRQVRNKNVQYPQQLLWLTVHGCYIRDRRMRIGDVQKPVSDFLCKAPDP